MRGGSGIARLLMLVKDLNAMLPACQCSNDGSMPCACVTGAPSASPAADSVSHLGPWVILNASL